MDIDWEKIRTEVKAQMIADKTKLILADADAYECAACEIESQPCDVGLAVKVERERIIKLLEKQLCECLTNPNFWDDIEKLRGEAYYAKYAGHQDCTFTYVQDVIELIKGKAE